MVTKCTAESFCLSPPPPEGDPRRMTHRPALCEAPHLSMPRTSSRRAGVPTVAAALFLALLATGCSGMRATPGPVAPVVERYPIIPAPRRLQARPGEFRLDQETRIMLSDPASRELRTLS